VTEQQAREPTRALCLGEERGCDCAETALVVLERPHCLHGGGAGHRLSPSTEAWPGRLACAVRSRAPIAVEKLAKAHIAAHAKAKWIAREMVAEHMTDMLIEFRAVDRRSLKLAGRAHRTGARRENYAN
jgi:hypothetical protein